LRFRGRRPFLEAGQFGGDADLLVRLIDIDLRPAEPVLRPGARPERCEIEPPKHVVEHAIHLAMQRIKRMDVGATLEADLAASVVPGNEILDGHGVFLLSQATSAADKPPRKSGW
jgi:hypothetical protein